MKLGLALARLIIGGLFIGHGTQKLFGWFGGHGREGTAGFFDSIGLAPGDRNAVTAGASETAGGALLVAGLFTPAASALLSGTMITAIRTVHLRNGVWSTNGGYELNLVYIASLLALVDAGPGAWSLDAARGTERWGTGWAIASIAAGAAGSAAVISAAAKSPAPPADAPTGDPSTTDAGSTPAGNGAPVGASA